MTGTLPSMQELLAGAYQELRALRAELDVHEREHFMPIAVVGIGCRLPGGADDPDAFWRLLRDGVDATSEVPRDRWDAGALYDPDPAAAGRIVTRRGAFLERVDAYDPAFFGISPREAPSLDPQQRLLLEVGWEALEHAGISPASLFGSRTGVFIGISGFEYAKLLMADPAAIDAYAGSGSALNVAAGRLAYTLGLTGPALAVDTACSSSLVATHLAVGALRRGECDAALAGGVNLILSPEVSISFSRAGFLAPDGRCKTFDRLADGYGRGEGCGILVLKRFDDALAAGDRVWALIRGSAVNQDGASGGLTVPSGPAQQAVMRQALAGARVRPHEVQFVEAHGTGTQLGDPIELGALDAVYGQGRAAGEPLLVGSVKTNVGHLEAAAGMAALIKTVLALHHGEVPAHLHLNDPNPHVPWSELALAVPTAQRSWPASEGPRRAGVSGFGFSGTNAHVILEQAPDPGPDSGPLPADDGAPGLLVLSARTPAALDALATATARRLRAQPPLPWPAACATAQNGRAAFEHRLAVLAAGGMEAATRLDAALGGGRPAGMSRGHVAPGARPRIGFLFTGQGSAWARMGRDLDAAWPAYRAAIDRCALVLDPILGHPLRSILDPAPGQPDLLVETAWAQPATVAVELALLDLWGSWGIRADAVLGHSLGEYPAAVAAGVMAPDDALRLVATRARLMQDLAPGAMWSVRASVDELAPLLVAAGPSVSIAAVNGPHQTVLAGASDHLAVVLDRVRSAGLQATELRVNRAFHSPLVEPMLGPWTAAVAAVRLSRPRIPMIWNVSGELAGSEIANPDAWVRQVREPVQFARGLEALRDLRLDAVLEIGPQPVLLALARSALPGSGMAWLHSLRADRDGRSEMLAALGGLFALGAPIDWRGVNDGRRPTPVSLPTYPFQRQRHWAAPAGGTSTADRTRPLSGPQLPSGQPTAPRGAGSADVRLFRTAWHEIAADPSIAASSPTARPDAHRGRWLVIPDRAGFAHEVAALVRAGGGTTVEAPTSAMSAPGAVGGITGPGPLADWLAAELARSAVAGILVASPLDADAVADPAEGLRLAAGVPIAALRAAASARASGGPRVWLLSRGALPATGRTPPSAVLAGAVSGVARVAALEQPGSWGGHIDLDPAGERAGEAARVLEEVSHVLEEDQRALRDGRRLGPVLVPVERPDAIARPLRQDGTYLVTGAFGGLGRDVVRWLAGRGARSLALLGRRGASSPEDRRSLEDLADTGVTVLELRADVGDEVSLRAALARIAAERPALAGVVHLAGTMSNRTIEQLQPSEVAAALHGKALGAWRLHELTLGHDLDCFVGFSSIAATWGSLGQAHYAAANAVLEALACRRHAMGLPATVIAWGPWATDGMFTADAERALGRVGVLSISPSAALDVLGRVIAQGEAVVTAAAADLGALRAAAASRRARPILAGIGAAETGAVPPLVAAPPRDAADPLVRALDERLAGAGQAERTAILEAHLLVRAAEVLGFAPGDLPDPRTGFHDLGMDSLMAVELRRRLESDLGRTLPATLAFDHPNARALAVHLAGDGTAAPPASASESDGRVSRPGEPPGEAPSVASAEDPARLTMDEERSALARELAALEGVLAAFEHPTENDD